uniref:Uncharacterized protein n=1 Tax=Desulfovibrio sp. U5L TaxID=596152 RepID=I2Q6M0_9BACT
MTSSFERRLPDQHEQWRPRHTPLKRNAKTNRASTQRENFAWGKGGSSGGTPRRPVLGGKLPVPSLTESFSNEPDPSKGEVYNLSRLEDFSGVYGQLESGYAGMKGKGELWLKNTKGVKMRLHSTTQGLELTAAAEGVVIKLKDGKK